MNIIQQFKDADGNNIYPIAYAQGGMKMDLLWTNPSPASSFAAQTINLDLSDYALLIVYYIGTVESSSYVPIHRRSQILLINGAETQLLEIGGAGDANSIQRPVVVSTSSITFRKGGYNSVTGANSDSGSSYYCVPVYIYGIKMSYIVPTTVHGLQYVEV